MISCPHATHPGHISLCQAYSVFIFQCTQPGIMSQGHGHHQLIPQCILITAISTMVTALITDKFISDQIGRGVIWRWMWRKIQGSRTGRESFVTGLQYLYLFSGLGSKISSHEAKNFYRLPSPQAYDIQDFIVVIRSSIR